MRPAAVALLPCLALVAAGVVSGGVAAAASGPAPSAATELVVDVRLTTAPALSATARANLVREAEAIWRRAGVRLRWVFEANLDPPADAALQVLVVKHDSAANDDDRHWQVGQLLVAPADRFVAVASIAAAERALELATTPLEPAMLRQRRLGLVLGRAVAHELGHFLLNTSSHGRSGLMRACIGADEMADLRSGAFFLDAEASRWLRRDPPVRLAHFDYEP